MLPKNKNGNSMVTNVTLQVFSLFETDYKTWGLYLVEKWAPQNELESFRIR